jgi:hypothetical protein
MKGIPVMSDESLIRHKSHNVRLTSYGRDGQWVPLAVVFSATVKEEDGYPVTGEPGKLFPTKDAADSAAKRLAIEWIDAQFPSAAD